MLFSSAHLSGSFPRSLGQAFRFNLFAMHTKSSATKTIFFSMLNAVLQFLA
jgi:hypothetical protein